MNKEITKIAELLKAVGNPVRVGIILLLEENGEMPVNSICAALKTEQSLTSHHLNNLKTKRLIKSRRNGKQVFYSLASEKPIELLDFVKTEFL